MDYETIFVTQPDVSESEFGEVLGEVKKILSDSKTSIDAEQNWGKKRLAYEIKKNTEGVYYYIKFSSSNSKVPNSLTAFYRYSAPVLRFLTIKLDKKKVKSK